MAMRKGQGTGADIKKESDCDTNSYGVYPPMKDIVLEGTDNGTFIPCEEKTHLIASSKN